MDKLTFETSASSGRIIVVEFFKDESCPDRWMHQIAINSTTPAKETRAVLLTSIEGDNETVWPPSPPVQDPSRHDLVDGGAVLGVGMAGKNHWSVSASVTGENQVLFDLACLVKSPGVSLASTYRCADGVTVSDIDGGVYLQHEFGQVALQAATELATRSSVSVDIDGRVLIAPVDLQPPADGRSVSIRWQYRILLVHPR